MRSKVAILQEPGRFTIEERDVCCAADEVLVKVAVCGLCNWEKGFFTGVLPGAPCTLGHEWAGMVVETGSEVTTLQPGDKVAVFPDALRGFAEYAPVKAANCFRLADHVDVYQGFAEPLKCVVTVLRSARPEAGDFGVVVGCGPMGLWCIQALAGRMLGGLIAVDIDDGKLAAAKQNGATHVISSKTQDAETLVREITGGHMADFVIEGTGIPALIAPSVKMLKTGRGRLVLMSYYERNAESFDFRPMADRGVIVTNPQPAFSEDGLEDTRRAVALINNGTFHQDGIITHRFALDGIQTAFEALVQKPAGYIKGVVICNETM